VGLPTSGESCFAASGTFTVGQGCVREVPAAEDPPGGGVGGLDVGAGEPLHGVLSFVVEKNVSEQEEDELLGCQLMEELLHGRSSEVSAVMEVAGVAASTVAEE
jgi:hypothetical protein